MATRKKKVVEDPANDIPVVATDAKAFKLNAKQRKVEWPKVTKGTHLTIYTYENGTTHLEWDDEALLNEVREATKRKVDNSVLNAYDDERLVTKHDKIQAKVSKKKNVKTKE